MDSFGQVQALVGPPSASSVYGSAEPISVDPIRLSFTDPIGKVVEDDSSSSSDLGGSSLVYEASKAKKVEVVPSDDEEEENSKDAKDEFEESLKLLEGEVFDFPAPPPNKIDPSEMPQQTGSSLFDLAHL